MKKSTPAHTGKIIPHGVKPEPHELDTILFYTERGEDVELIVPSNTPHAKNADCLIHGLVWETKSPTNNRTRTIERIFYQASRQFSNIIIDLRRAKNSDQKTITLLEKLFKNTRHARNMHIISGENNLKTYRK